MSESITTNNGAPPNKKRRRDRNRGGKKNVFNGDGGNGQNNTKVRSVFDIEAKLSNGNRNNNNNSNNNGNNMKHENKNKSKNNNYTDKNTTNNMPNVMSLSSIEGTEQVHDENENQRLPSAEAKKHFITESKFGDLPISNETKRGIS